MKKILVTGASGFIGSHCLKVLQKENFEIYALAKTIPQHENTNINWIETDLSQPKEVDQLFEKVKPEYLLHLAWEIVPGKYLGSHNNNKWVEISMNLIRKFVINGGKKLVISGSCAEYKWGKYICNEKTTPLEPHNIYGLSKHKLHQEVAEFCKQDKISYVWGRIFHLYGPRENPKRLVPHVIRSVLKGHPVKTTHGNQVYDYLYVEDVARALVGLIQTEYTGAVNICSGQPIKLKDLIFKIAGKMDASHLIQLGKVKSNEQHEHYIVGSNNLLNEVTCWEQLTYLDDGLDKTIDYIRNSQTIYYG